MVQLPSGEVQNAIGFLVLFYLAAVLRLDPLDDERRRGKPITISDLSHDVIQFAIWHGQRWR